ncbi:putative kinetochore protein spc24 [Elasticomyces elasticus]|nr:putative kinetochore protein spc24 [Elasticomyces elasticus]KAK3650816.1 putative kinetochore protein spc24 [Elasticomyces elasticus]KAK4918520.1 putative kinetochore protein spc24 [Elasticomyces elasticus]KAK5757842.1 putative kinetochore protein spc24 [Elasticomyces elasticus]
MVLFDEDPVILIKATTDQFKGQPDRDSISRISSSLSQLQNARQLRLNDHHATIKQLSRRLNNLHSQIGFEEERHDAGKHASEMLRMDTEKFRIAKGVSDAEVETERLGSDLASLRSQLDVLEKEGVEGGRRVGGEAEDEIVLKLSVYRSLGIDVSQDASTGDFNRAVIRNTSKGDVTVIDVEGKSRSSQADQFWASM